ncbi:hypothetical protein B7463_g6115, partial [Scytalidium lignicola]
MGAFIKGLKINVASMVQMAKYAIPEMMKNEGQCAGSIVNMSSIAGLFGGTSNIMYPTSKEAIINMTRIRVNCICLGMVYTPMMYYSKDGISQQEREARKERSLLKTEGNGWDIGAAVRFLASDLARWVTGVILPIDAGTTAVTGLVVYAAALIVKVPVDKEATFILMKKYVKVEATTTKEVVIEPELPTPGTPATLRQVQYQLGELKPKVMDLLSSPSQLKFESFTRGTTLVLDEGELVRTRLKKGGELSGEQAQAMKEEKDRKQAQKAANKEARMLRQIANKERRDQKVEHTPPPFLEPGKEPVTVDQKPLVLPAINSTENTFHRPPQTPVQYSIRTSFTKPELQEELQQQQEQPEEQEQEEEVSDDSKESYIRLDLEGEIGYSSSDLSNSVDSSDSEESSGGGYFKL